MRVLTLDASHLKSQNSIDEKLEKHLWRQSFKKSLLPQKLEVLCGSWDINTQQIRLLSSCTFYMELSVRKLTGPCSCSIVWKGPIFFYGEMGGEQECILIYFYDKYH